MGQTGPHYGERLPGDMRDFILQRLGWGWPPQQIYDAGNEDPQFTGRQFPSTKTIQRMKSALPRRTAQVPAQQPRPARGTVAARWSVSSAAADEVALVLPVLRVALERYGPDAWPSTEDARIVANVARAAPGLAPEWVHEIATKYTARRASGDPTESLDELLAFRPWESEAAFMQYVVRLAGTGRYPRPLPGGALAFPDGAAATALRIYCATNEVSFRQVAEQFFGETTSRPEGENDG